MWWATEKDDQMYGKDYVVKQLQIPSTYYSFSRKGWHFFVLDSNHKGATLGDEQFEMVG